MTFCKDDSRGSAGACMLMKSICAATLLLVGIQPSVARSAPESAKPNVLFIAIDDLRPELGCYGVKEIKTPEIDALAASGIMFNRAYCQLAVCNPSRVSLLTGMRPDATKVWDLATRFRHAIPDAVTLPQQFKKHGYHAVSFGKIFHNPWPDDVSWSEPHRWPEKSSLWSREARQRLAARKKKMRAEGRPEKAVNRVRAQATEKVDVPDHEHIDGAIAEQTIAAMKRLAKKDQPFFLAAGFIRPHLPFVAPRKYWNLYDEQAIPMASNAFLPRQSPRFAMNTMYELRDYLDFAGTPSPHQGPLTEARRRRLKHGYYASVSFIDALVGRLLAELETQGLADNTIVVLWGDHGWKLGEHNSWCKQTNYEIDARVPLIIRAPGAKGNGRSSNALVELIDLYPTLCELAKLPLPESLEGKSMTPLLSRPDLAWKDAAFSQFPRRDGPARLMGYAMRTDRYRYVEWQDRRTRQVVSTELYDHAKNSLENTNVAGRAEHQPLIAKLSRQMWSVLPDPPKYDPPKPASKQDPLKPASKPKSPKQEPLKQASKRPNIVFCMADDWSWPHAGILGDPVVKTPHFDRVAREGVLFENAFVSTPSCTGSVPTIVKTYWKVSRRATIARRRFFQPLAVGRIGRPLMSDRNLLEAL
ncbi:MAG: sulfatase-like hydrolase/transferase, partial [Planctomycetales bacterium]